MRPLVSQRIINDVIAVLDCHNAVAVAVPATDTILERETGSSYIGRIPDRRTLMYVQTPQAFRLSTIAEAFERALREGNIAATDDVGIVYRYMPETPVFIVPGEEQNRKITYKEDLAE